MGFLRVVSAACILFPFGFRARSSRSHPLAFRHILVIALFGYTYPFVVQPFFIQRHGTALVAMIISLVPVFTVIILTAMKKRLPSTFDIFCIGAGGIFLSLIYIDALKVSVTIRDILLVSTIPVSYAFTNIYIERKLPQVSPARIASRAFALSALCLLPFAYVMEWQEQDFLSGLLKGIWPALCVGGICTGLGMIAFYHLIQTRGVIYSSIISYCIPCVALCISITIGEQVYPLQWVGLAGIYAVALLIQFQSRRK